MTIKLTDLQLVLLTSAAQREDGNLLPPPESVSAQMPRLRRAIMALLKHALVEEVPVTDERRRWREEDGACLGLVITATGRSMIGDEQTVTPPEVISPVPCTAAPPTKIALVVDLLRRDGGATLAELAAATQWLPHTTRAALTGLRKKGHAIDKSVRDGATAYSIKAVA